MIIDHSGKAVVGRQIEIIPTTPTMTPTVTPTMIPTPPKDNTLLYTAGAILIGGVAYYIIKYRQQGTIDKQQLSVEPSADNMY